MHLDPAMEVSLGPELLAKFEVMIQQSIAAGLALQEAGVVKADVDIKGVVKALIDPAYLPTR